MPGLSDLWTGSSSAQALSTFSPLNILGSVCADSAVYGFPASGPRGRFPSASWRLWMSRPCSVGINPRPGRSGPLLRGRSGSGEHQTRVLSCAGPGAECCWLTPGGAALWPGRSPGGAGGSAALVARVPSPGWEAGRPRCARTGPEASWLPPAPAQPGSRPAECRAVRVSPQPVAARASAFQPAGFWPSSAVHVNAFLGRCSPEVLRTVGSQDSGFSGWWLPRMVGSQDSGSQDGGFSGPWLLRTVGSQDGGFSGRWLLRTVGCRAGNGRRLQHLKPPVSRPQRAGGGMAALCPAGGCAPAFKVWKGGWRLEGGLSSV